MSLDRLVCEYDLLICYEFMMRDPCCDDGKYSRQDLENALEFTVYRIEISVCLFYIDPTGVVI